MVVMRSVAAVVGGIAAFTLLLLAAMSGGNALLGSEPEWINRSVMTQVVWLLWNVVSMVAAGYCAAVIALRSPAAHAVVMGALQSLFTLMAMFTVTDTATPPWLWLAGASVTPPAAWIGARLRTTRRRALEAISTEY
jgi:hypothetical protein